MRKFKSLSLKKILLAVLAPLTLGIAVAGGAVSTDTAKALPDYPYTTTVEKPLYDYTDYRYSREALDSLAKTLLDDNTKTINDLITYIKTNALTHGKPVDNKSITLKYGRYQNTPKDSYHDLTWMPVYMSTTSDGSSAVLTLYLTTANGPISQEEYSPFSSDSLVTTSPQTQDPTNMYSTSFIRAKALGNGGDYIDCSSGSPVRRFMEKSAFEACNKYMDFQEYTYTLEDKTKEVRKGYLYDDIVTPSQLEWQSNESYKAEIGTTGEIVFESTSYGTGWEEYCWPNDAYGTPVSGSFFQQNYFDYGTGTGQKTGYDVWKNDKVWLPSVTEVGTGDMTGSDMTGLNGLWKLSKNQRANCYSSSMMAAQDVAWLRSACTAFDAGSGYSVSHMFVTEGDGTVSLRTLDYSDETNPLEPLYANRIAVRPAIHLNLSKAVEKIDPPVILPDKVTATYIGAEHKLDATNMTLTPAQAPWFVQGDMNVRFAYDKEFKKLANPINAGEYYMEVRLDNPGLHFVNSSSNTKIVKFVIEKAKIGVKWTMDGNVPTAVTLSPSSKFYPRDELAGNIPEIGIKYISYTTSGLYFYDFDELLRGTYSAEAYIINEDMYDYNYQLSDDMGDPVVANSKFDVGRKIIDKPIVTGAGTGAPALPSNIITYTLSYKGDQYIQLANVSKYLRVSVTSQTGEGKIECLNDTQEVIENGHNVKYPIVSDSGTLTYKISDVDLYTFNIAFPNTTQFTWPGSYDFSTGTDNGADINPYKLAVNVTRAKLDIEFAGLPNEWLSIQSQQFEIEIRGLYEQVDGSEIPLSVFYISDKGAFKQLTPTLGVYTLPADLPAGTYTLSAGLAQSNNKYNDLYYIESNNKTQNFKIIQAVSSFSDSLVQWQYSNDGTVTPAGGFLDHDRPESSLEFDYNGDFYIFSLTIGEATLRDTYYVKAVYSCEVFKEESNGYVKCDKFVRDAGKYKATVVIDAYYKNVSVDKKEYNIYFNINPAKYDLSDLEWDYSGTPFTFDGARHKVRLTPESLATVPGLTVEYNTEGNRIDAGKYKTAVSFLVSGDYAKNYVLPVSEDDSTYEGTFAFDCEWFINKAKLTVEWQTAPESGGNIQFVPVLKKGGEYVTYKYEHKEADGSWTPAETLKAEGADETYRVNAEIKSEYVNNYELDGVTSCEFTVASGKQAVSVHFEKDGEVIHDGDGFPYTGKPITIELIVDSDGLTLSTYTFKYYSVAPDDTRTELATAPTDVGKYVAEVTAKYGADSFISDACASEVSFEITKADYDVNYISWMYEHGDKTIAGKYDPEQEKWVDDNGKEVEFSFEYDGTPHTLTVECQQEFDDPDDRLSVLKLSGNVETNAGTYTAAVDFTYNAARFNNPHSVFNRLLKWTITKKKIDYNKVKWGYIDSEGKEREFNFDKDVFRYSRDENGPVGVTVALIGLPKGVQDLMTYQTKNLSVSAAAATAGNTRAAVGDYMTSFTITGTWNDPQGNHEDFDSTTFPLAIPASQTWTIKRRELSKLDYDGSWTKFDDRVHDVLELCKIPYNELDYLKFDITFVDKAFSVFNEYEGYDGVANKLYHAGTYDIKLYEKMTVYKDGAEVEELLVWDSLTIEVGKNELEVDWDTDGAYPIARALGVYATDMLTTVYTRLNGAEVPIAYIKSTNGDESFYATVKISDKYLYDITIKMAANQPERIEFYYSPFSPLPGAVELDFPKLVGDEKEYTGSELKFEIEGWETKYKEFLYISQGKLEQTYIGEYKVVLRFYKSANAYWKNSTSESGQYNRDAYTLTFNIISPSKWALDYPKFDALKKDWNNDEEVEFEITNWVALSQYLTYEVFYNGESLGKDINLIFRYSGIYSVDFTFPSGSIGYWKENKDAPNSKYTVQLTLFDPNNVLVITYPQFVVNTYEYTGSPLQFKVAQWDYYSQYVDVVSKDNVTIKDGVVTATDVGVYNITFNIKADAPVTFVNGITTYTLSISVTPKKGDDNNPTAINKPTDLPSQQYTGEDLKFTLTGWASIYKDYIDVEYDETAVTFNDASGEFTVKNIGVYTITLKFKTDAKAYWAGTENSTEAVQIKFEVTRPDDPTIVVQPSLKNPEKQWNGKDQTFELVNFDASAVEIVGGDAGLTKKDVGEYSITLTLKNKKSDDNPDGQTWLDGSTDDITLNFRITKLKLPEGGGIGVGEDGKPIIVDKDGNPVPGLDVDLGDLFDLEYFDKDGNPVDFKDLKPGEKYTVKIKVKDPAVFDGTIENGSSVREEISNKNDKGEFVINVYTPSDPNNGGGDDGGFNPLWWIAIGAGILAVIAIIGVIIGLATRRNGGNDGYGDYDEGYDDYDDDEYDDDEYDDDYDDYDGDDYDDEY